MQAPVHEEIGLRVDNFSVSILEHDINLQIIFLCESCIVWIGLGTPELSSLIVRFPSANVEI